jgi:hypothetical protein
MEVGLLPGILAKVLGLVELVLDEFITVDIVGYGTCNIAQYQVNTTTCGDALISQLSTLVFGAVQLIAGIIGASVATIA